MGKMQTLFQLAVNAYWEYRPWWTSRRLTMPLDEIEIDRPIFILGVQGGGLTLLTRMLHRHEHVVTIGGGRAYWVGNNEMDKHYIGQLPEVFTLRSPGYQSPTFKTHMTGKEENHPLFGLERDWVYACEHLLDQYRKTEDDWTQETEDRFIRAIKESVRAYATDPGQARYLDMSQTFALKVPLLRRIFPDARFIVLTRNPYAVCLRAMHDFRYAWVRRMEATRETKLLKLKIVAEHWRNTFAFATQDLEDYKRKVFVRHEDLVVHPEEVLQRITEVADLSYDPDMIPREHHQLPLGSKERHKWYPLRTDTNNRHLERLDPAKARLIEKEVEPIASKLGYRAPV